MKKINLLKNKKLVIISLCSIILIIVVALLLKLFVFNNKVKITLSEVSKLELVDYSNENFTMEIPTGWKVATAGVDMFYIIHVYDPQETANQIYVSLKAAPFTKSNASRTWWQNYTKLSNNYANSKMFANAIILNPATTENFYSNFNNYADYAKIYEPTYKDFTFPFVSTFTKIETFEANNLIKKYALDDKVIRATFENDKAKKCEGLFMASIVSAGTNYIGNVDVLYNMAYNVIFISSLENEMINYEDLLLSSLKTLQYTNSFVETTNKNIQIQTDTVLKANATIQQAFDSYNNAWSKRQTTYDITSQKYSDATLGYERVYDVKTGEIYKVYNGFTDDYKGKRYQAISDDMYSKNISGYIEK